MSIVVASIASVKEQPSCSFGGLGACPQQVKKGRSPLLGTSFFKECGATLHTCIQKIKQNNKINHKLKKGQKNETK
jgi:hypothetical protein